MNKSLREEIIEWNNRFPVDRWWREKHGIAFNSASHRETSFLDQLFEYQEDKLFLEVSESSEYITISNL